MAIQQIKTVKSHKPMGLLKEYDAMGIPADEWGSCAPPDKNPLDRDGQIVGCSACKKCTLPEKFTKGPVNKGVRLVKMTLTGVRVIHRPMSCYNIPKERERMEINGGVLEIIANEGETMYVQGSTPEDVNIPGQGMVRKWVDGEQEITVPVHPRPKDNPIFKKQALAYRAIEEERARQRAGRVGKLLGVEDEGGRSEAPRKGR